MNGPKTSESRTTRTAQTLGVLTTLLFTLGACGDEGDTGGAGGSDGSGGSGTSGQPCLLDSECGGGTCVGAIVCTGVEEEPCTETEGTCSTPSGGGGSGAGDDCVDGGGVRNSMDACVKECQRDGDSPGNDLFGDCTDVRMVCTHDDFCAPNDYCSSDAACGDGYVCVWFRYVGTYCHPLCETSNDCPGGGSTCQMSGTSDSPNPPAERRVCHK